MKKALLIIFTVVALVVFLLRVRLQKMNPKQYQPPQLQMKTAKHIILKL